MAYKFLPVIGFLILAFLPGRDAWASPDPQQVSQPRIHHNGPSPAFQGLEACIGSPHAPLTIIMYYSLTCPHCHEFQETVLPQIQKEYIDKKLVRFIFRDFPTDGLALKAAKLAWCLGRDHYLHSAKRLLATQDKWAATPDTEKALHEIARDLGITGQDCQKCLDRKDVEDVIVRTSFEAQKNYQLTGAPAFVINGKVYEGNLTLETIHELLLKMGIHG